MCKSKTNKQTIKPQTKQNIKEPKSNQKYKKEIHKLPWVYEICNTAEHCYIYVKVFIYLKMFSVSTLIKSAVRLEMR